jgi:hypothetical protein
VAFSENGEMESRDLRVRNKRHAVKTSPSILHSSPAEEKKFGFPFSENMPSAIQGEGATSPFSDLREWEERGVTTPIIMDRFTLWTMKLDQGFVRHMMGC